MILKTVTVELTPEARDALTSFLKTRAGEIFFEALSAGVPSIPKSGTAEDRLAGAYTHAGYEECLDTIRFFVTPQPEVEHSEPTYPDVEDDRAWEKEQGRVEAAKQ